MNSRPHKMLLYLPILFSLFINGCSSLYVIDLNPQPLTSNNLKHDTNLVVGIETIDIAAGGYEDAEKWQQGLADALRNEGTFNTITQTFGDKQNIDLLIRTKVSGNFHHNGTKNFFTWWPGPLVYAQGWRGTRFIYDAASDVEIIDANSGVVLGNYHAESSHELIHRSYNPWHFFGTILIIPGTIKASLSTFPRPFYREEIYKAAYPALWKKMAILIEEDQSKIYSRRIASLQEQCGIRFNEEIAIDMLWSEFVSCQTGKFKFLGQEPMESGLVSIYVKNDKSLRIHVAEDDRIIRWYIAKYRE